MASWQNNSIPPCNTYSVPSTPPRSLQHNANQYGPRTNTTQPVSNQWATSPPRQQENSSYNNAFPLLHSSPPHQGQPAYYHSDNQPYQQQQHIPNSPETQLPKTEPIAFFLFFNCKTTGTNIHKDKIVEIALQCWPYIENAPVFHCKVDDEGEKHRQERQKNSRSKKGW